jgi:hypothetical protein
MQSSVDRSGQCVDERINASIQFVAVALDKLFDIFDIFFTNRKGGFR